MPSISKIRFTNVVFEEGMKRYNDEIFKFDGYNGAILLENGGGKTVFIQTALQAIIPHTNLSDRKIKQTLQLDNYPAHIAIEWILSEHPRRYLVTCVSLFLTKDGLGSYRYVYPYQPNDNHNIEGIPFVRKDSNRPSDRGEISDYYQQMTQLFMNAQTFSTIKAFQSHIQEQYQIIANEWESIVKINSTEGGVEAFFDECRQTNQLFDRLLIPTVEDAISGHEQSTFSDTFEKHRSSFKLYKELKAQIEENKAIEDELNRYVLTYEGLHEQQQMYERKKQRAKAVLQLIDKQETEVQAALEDNQEKMKEWEGEDNQHLKKKLSLNIYQEKEKLVGLENVLQEYQQNLTMNEEDLFHANKHFYSLKHAEFKKDQKEEQGRIQSLSDQLAALDQEEDVEEINDKLNENSQELKGYFVNKQEESNRRKHELIIEKQPIEEQLEQASKQKKAQEDQLEHTKVSYYNNDGKIANLNQQMKRIQQKILSNPDQESVKDQLKKWEARLVDLDEQIVQLKNDNKQLAALIMERKQQKETLAKQKEEIEHTRVKLSLETEQVERAHLRVKEVLGTLRAQWLTLDSIYLKQESLGQQLRDHILQLNKKRDQCLLKERIAHRFVDDYGSQDLFFADPFLDQQIKQWRNQFNLLERGIEFVQSLEGAVPDKITRYPLWSMTLITTAAEQEQLKQKIQNIDQELQFPIEVLTIEQARAIVQGEELDALPIVPSHWLQNQQVGFFVQWKEQMKRRAEEETDARRDVEDHIEKWKKGAELFTHFLQENPYEAYQERNEQLNERIKQLQDLNAQQQEIDAKLTEAEEKLANQQERITTYGQEYNGIHEKVVAGYDFSQLEKESIALQSIQEQLSGQIDTYQRGLKRTTTQINRLEDVKRSIEDREKDENYYYQTLLEDELYLEVKNVEPKYTNKEKNILNEEREQFKLALRQLSSTRNELQLQLDHAQKELNRLTASIDEWRADYDSLDEEMVFPPNGKEQIIEYRNKRKELEKKVKRASEQFTEINESKIRQEKALEIAEADYRNVFPDQEPDSFVESISEAQAKLKDEKRRLTEKYDYLQRERQRISEVHASIKAAFHELDRFEEAHHFKGPSVIAHVLAEKDIQAFTYERIKFVQELTVQLKQGKEAVSKEWKKVVQARDFFKAFCKSKITNIKMREMARQGIDNKQSYKEVVEFQAHMQKRIQTAIKYNEASIINHDKQLEQFVTHINSHLRTIAGELALMPRKTKVKVEDKWKDIYKFTIPEWTEEEGKVRIRKRIEWILDQLESEKYLSDDGTEDYGKVRKDIETWLQSKQLLRIAMNNEMMKVSCRKVTNDNQVTSRSYTWEQSNVWSGGEKWSKNMTLFLGILNYVAEKQMQIEPNMKRHRVVILDNPFGKASSDHVLNPVFFIAEQLGFQMIALTAHAEGKFLRDYFPILYSCRLRKAAHSNKQVMTKVKQLHHAYFQDHEPEALERLGEVEQMALF